jgi:hypothetical protein
MKENATEVRDFLTKNLRLLSLLIKAEIHFYNEDLLAPKGIENNYQVSNLHFEMKRSFRKQKQCFHCLKTVESYIALVCTEKWMKYSFDFSIS